MSSPLLTVAVPAYNCAEFLGRALAALCAADARVEVVVVDDGSTDATGMLAESYAHTYPDRIRVVHQTNGGHGAAIDAGIAHARGSYLKVLDADDWLSSPALARVLDTLDRLEEAGGVDAVFTDFVHDRVGKPARATRFDTVFPADRVFGWEQTQRFGRRQYLMMHAVIYRTALLREVGLVLPRHTFYVDSLYVLRPLARVRRMYYLPVPLYHYYIGRSGQSVAPEVMLARVDQQLRVNRLALETVPSIEDVRAGRVPSRLYDAQLHYIRALCATVSATLALGGTAQHLAVRRAFWREVKRDSPRIHGRLRRSLVGAGSNLPGYAGRRVTRAAYHLARRYVGFS
ncbi:glycosyltransferase family A protein [Microbacterium binotii]|uniref:Glycosyltransferase family 2 protein n=1 Tax=Microbacterium binotii TaxID=462710 RepID=A0ABN3PJK6_9MICO